MTSKIFLVNVPNKHDILLVCSDHCCELHDSKPKKVELTPAEIERLTLNLGMIVARDGDRVNIKLTKQNKKEIVDLLKKLSDLT